MGFVPESSGSRKKASNSLVSLCDARSWPANNLASSPMNFAYSVENTFQASLERSLRASSFPGEANSVASCAQAVARYRSLQCNLFIKPVAPLDSGEAPKIGRAHV